MIDATWLHCNFSVCGDWSDSVQLRIIAEKKICFQLWFPAVVQIIVAKKGFIRRLFVPK